MSLIGHSELQQGDFRAFIPAPFPALELLQVNQALQVKHATAVYLLGQLEGVTQLIPDRDCFLLLSHGAVQSIPDIRDTNKLLKTAELTKELSPADDRPTATDDLLRYLLAIDSSLDYLRGNGLNFSCIQSMHRQVAQQGRTTHFSQPGNFRDGQNWINGTGTHDAKYVPPPAVDMQRHLQQVIDFFNDDTPVLPLIKAGLLYAQFETVHPFHDANGRTGHLLVMLYLSRAGLLELPVLYLASFLNQHKNQYYDRLNIYQSDNGSADAWLDFFLDGIIATAQASLSSCRAIIDTRLQDMIKIRHLHKDVTDVTLQVLHQLYAEPIVELADIAAWIKSMTDARRVVRQLVKAGVLVPIGPSGPKQLYAHQAYVHCFRR